MSQYQRIQRCRTQGWKAPEFTKYVGRGTVFGNPFPVTKRRDAAHCKALYRYLVCGNRGQLPADLRIIRDKIRSNIWRIGGFHLMCWCPAGTPCHADWLLDWANNDEIGFPELRNRVNLAAVVAHIERGKSIEELAAEFQTTAYIIDGIWRQYRP